MTEELTPSERDEIKSLLAIADKASNSFPLVHKSLLRKLLTLIDAPVTPDRGELREKIARVIEAAMGAVAAAALDLTMTHDRMGVIADEARDKAIDQIIALAASPVSPGTEWVVVPREPTEAMIDAGRDANDQYATEVAPCSAFRALDAYRAMIAAAPRPDLIEVSASPPEGDTGWRDIASAPKDVSVLARTTLKRCVVVTMLTSGGCSWPYPAGDEPVVWRPLPPPPTPATGDDRSGRS